MLDALLQPDQVYCRIEAASRKRVLQFVSEQLAGVGVPADDLFDGLLERERLGSTGLGDGVAIPHCRAAFSSIRVCLLTTAEPVDYEAVDGEKVDIFFVLIVPNDEHQLHLRALAELSTTLDLAENRQRLRTCNDPASLHQTMLKLLSEGAA